MKTYVDAKASTNSSALASEVSRATSAENTNATAIDAEKTRATAAEASNAAAISLKENSANKSTDTDLSDATNTKFPTEAAVKAYVDTKVAAATIADADASTKGKIQLAGDLAGTAAAPTVPGLSSKAPINNPTFTGLPSAPTAASGNNTNQLATTAFVNSAISGISSSNFVDLTTNQSIAGVKTFSNNVNIAGVLTAGGTALPSSTGSAGQVLTISSSGSSAWTSIIREVTAEVVATSAQTSFTLPQVPGVNCKVKMYVNGVLISFSAHSVSGVALTYISSNNGNYTLFAGDRVQFIYFY